MSLVALYNMKGGVGKTTAAVNLSYLSAAAGQRTLLVDLDPQAASSFAFRVRPSVSGFGKKTLASGEALAAAIKETDYDNLDLLPADFAYRKLDRLLGRFGHPTRVVATLLDRLGRDYDVVFLDCPAGFSLLTEGVLEASDVVLVPTIPSVLSLRMVSRILKCLDRSNSSVDLAAFFSMVDRRKTLHRRASDSAAGLHNVFLTGQIPYASVVEQMAVRRMPLPVFAPRELATTAFARIWTELQTRLQHRREREETSPRPRDRWALPLRAIEALIARLESAGAPEAGTPAAEDKDKPNDVCFVHNFDTADRDLQRCGYVLELRERAGRLHLVAARSDSDDGGRDTTKSTHTGIDSCWAVALLAGTMSPLEVLQRRLVSPMPELIEQVMAIVDGRRLRRVGSRIDGQVTTESPKRPDEGLTRRTLQPLAAISQYV